MLQTNHVAIPKFESQKPSRVYKRHQDLNCNPADPSSWQGVIATFFRCPSKGAELTPSPWHAKPISAFVPPASRAEAEFWSRSSGISKQTRALQSANKMAEQKTRSLKDTDSRQVTLKSIELWRCEEKRENVGLAVLAEGGRTNPGFPVLQRVLLRDAVLPRGRRRRRRGRRRRGGGRGALAGRLQAVEQTLLLLLVAGICHRIWMGSVGRFGV